MDRRAVNAARRLPATPGGSMRCIGSILVLAMLTGCLCSAQALEAAFEGGHLRCHWSDDGFLELRIKLAPRDLAIDEAVWVVTLDADRFDDGIFAWQWHIGGEHESVIVIPNDFLTTVQFRPPQLGVEAARGEDVGDLVLRIPREGVIPNLVMPGDRIELHALWIQQPPLVGFLVPPLTEAIADAGHDAQANPAGGGGAAPEPGALEPTDPFPAARTFEQGEAIERSFIIVDPGTGEPRFQLGASISLLRVRGGQPDEFVRFSHIPQDRETGLLAYSIDTSTLAPGAYRLVIATADGETRFDAVFEILAATRE